MMQAPPLARGPSLPPGVIGELLGTLTIRLQACSVNDIIARVQFWGEQTYSDLSLTQDGESRAIEYPLLGSISALCTYLIDASPLKVTFLRHSQNRQHPRTEERVSSSVQSRPVIVGFAYIRDICISDLTEVSFEKEGAHKTVKFLLRRESPIVSPDVDLNCHKIHIGEAGFELFFRLLVCSDAATARLRDCSGMHGLPERQAMLSSTTLPGILHCLDTMPPITQPASINDCNCNQSVNDDSTRVHSDFCVSGNEEKQSLLEELLDLCSDDMTIPTVDSANTCVDPYDMWLSRMIENASSPSAQGFPSLQSAGSHQSHALKDIGMMKLEVTGINLCARIANKINGYHDFILEYDSPPLPFDRGKAGGTTEFVVCERFGYQQKAATFTRRTPPKDRKHRGNENEISLLKNVYARQMEVAIKNDDCVRMWLDGTMNFRLCYRASKVARYSKLPRVAMLGSKGKETTLVPKPNSILCMAKACLRLRDVILSDTLSFDGKLDLVLINDELAKNIAEVGNKVGTLMVQIGLHADSKKACDAVTSSPPAAKETQILMRVPIPSSASTPHPLSVLLSRFAGGSNDDTAVALPSSNLSNTKRVSSYQVESLEISPHEQHSPLKQAMVSPVWLNIRVDRISKLTTHFCNENTGCFKLGMSCSKQSLSMLEMTQSQIYNKEFGQGPLEIFTLTTNDFNTIQNAICSWKVPIEAEDKRDDLATVTLHVWYCKTASAKRLVGLANISFLIEPSYTSERKLCDLLSCIVANSKFDLLDPRFHTPIGNVQVLVAVGSLDQLTALSTGCERIVIIQRYWRRSRNFAKQKETRALHPYRPTRDSPQQDHVPEFDTNHAGIVSQTYNGLIRHLRDAASSPDSLFDEWSQQSLLLKNDVDKSTVQHEGDEIQHATHASTCSSQTNEREEKICDYDDGSSQVTDDEPDIKTKSRSRASEKHTTHNFDVMKESSDIHPIPYEHFDLIVRLEKISGIREILSAWCSEHGRAVRETLLSVSGFFVSFGFDNAFQVGEAELHKLCSDDSWHSKLIPFEGITRDVEVNLKWMISVPDYGDDTEMILTQTLQFKLWFVPVITTTIAAMIDADNTKDIISLKGCIVISTATFPLYHIYSIKGCYSGGVPWSVALHRDQRAIFVGFISMSMRRVNLQPCPIRMLQALDEQCNLAKQCHMMSTLKPTNLEVSFSHEQDDYIRQTICIDPPEQIKSDCLPPSSKRSSRTSSESDECKRYKVTKNLGSQCSPAMSTVDDDKRTTSSEQDIGLESEIINQGDPICVERDDCSDADDEISCRSLTSMIGSLDKINSKLTRGADPTVKVYASSDMLASFEVGASSNALYCDTPPETDVPSNKSKPDSPTSLKTYVPSNNSKPDCPGRQTEPPDENYVIGTSLYHQAIATSRDRDKVESSEKASSPMSAVSYISAKRNTVIENGKHENHNKPHKSEENQTSSERKLEEPMTNGNSNCNVSASHNGFPEGSLDRKVLDKLIRHYWENDWRRQGEAPQKYGSMHFTPSDSLGSLQYRLGDRRNSVLSQSMQPSILSRFDSLTTDASSWGGRVDSSTRNVGRSNAKIVDIERLERIFRS